MLPSWCDTSIYPKRKGIDWKDGWTNDQPKVKKCIFVTETRNKKKKLHEAVTYPLAKCSYTTSPACVQPDALLFQWCKDSSVDLRLMKRQDVGVKVDA